MRIIERGNTWFSKEQPVKFHCFRCGCTFEMDNTEYRVEYSSDRAQIYAHCPNCGWMCFPYKRNDR